MPFSVFVIGDKTFVGWLITERKIAPVDILFCHDDFTSSGSQRVRICPKITGRKCEPGYEQIRMRNRQRRFLIKSPRAVPEESTNERHSVISLSAVRVPCVIVCCRVSDSMQIYRMAVFEIIVDFQTF